MNSAGTRGVAAASALAALAACQWTVAGAEPGVDDLAATDTDARSEIHDTRIHASERARPVDRAAAPHHHAGVRPALRGGDVDFLDAADQYTFFEGFETYSPGPLNQQTLSAPPGVAGILARDAMVIAPIAGEGLPPGRDPFGTGDLNLLKDARGVTGSVSLVSETRWRYELERFYFPTPEQDLIISIDMFFPDSNTLYSFEPVSFQQDQIVTRVLQAGRWQNGLTDSTSGELTRPAVLGLFQPPFGQFYAPPLNTGTDGALPPFSTRFGEWFTIAVRMSDQGFSVWIRDSQTDGSAGPLIEDPQPPQFLESGWVRIFPGRVAVQSAPGVWTGYGVAINEFGEEAVQAEQFLAANAVDAIQSVWFPAEAVPNDPLWFPTNRYMNNISILGPSVGDCPWDLTGSGAVGPGDLGFLLGCWGPLIADDCSAADFTGSGGVGASDLAQILSNWGPCP